MSWLRPLRCDDCSTIDYAKAEPGLFGATWLPKGWTTAVTSEHKTTHRCPACGLALVQDVPEPDCRVQRGGSDVPA